MNLALEEKTFGKRVGPSFGKADLESQENHMVGCGENSRLSSFSHKKGPPTAKTHV